VQTPIAKVASVTSILNTPLTGADPSDDGVANPADVPGAPTQTLGTVASLFPGETPGGINHYTVQRVIDVAAGVDGRDLGSVVRDIRAQIAPLRKRTRGPRTN